MNKTPLPEQKKRELLFLLFTAVVIALCTALAFRFAVPLRGDSQETLPDLRELTEYLWVDLNTVDEAALSTLPGVGPQLAARITEYRRQNGPFAQVEDVVLVPGITQEMLDSWTGQVYVS